MKKYIRILLSVCAAMVLTTAAAAVEPPQEPYPTGVSGEARWTLQGDTMYVTGQGLFSGVSNADSQPWEFFEEQIRHVVVADGVTLIGDNIFAHTYNLETVTIADSVTEICEGAFRNCYGLKKVKLPSNLQTLGNFVFAYCEKLESIELPDTLTTMGEGVFTGCAAMTSVRLPTELYDIRQMNFDSCMSLTEVTIPAGVGFLRHASFPNCFNLKKVVFEGDQPNTNGDPFYMGPEDLTVYCYDDARGWDDPLFYTYPVVKLQRAADLPTEAPPEKPQEPATGGDQEKEKQEDLPFSGENQPTTGTIVPEIPAPPEPTPPAAAGDTPSVPDAPVTGGEKQENIPSDDLAGGDETEKKQNRSPVLLGGAVIAVCGVGFFVFRKKKS